MTVQVGILGATGAVGQRFVQLLDEHPTFELTCVTASDDSVGETYREAAEWRLSSKIPEFVADQQIRETDPSVVSDGVELIFSSLPSDVAAAVEPDFLEAGYVVSSNSSNDRMAPDIPLTIPEINPGHLGLLEVQQENRDWDGALVKNPNCSTITMVPTLAALDRFGLESVNVSTLQAVSGAGYSGVSSMEIIDNAIPHIGNEERKMETEARKLLGDFDGAELELHETDIAASCNRIPTLDGHLENVFAEFASDPDPGAVREAFRDFESADLHSSPDQLIKVFEQDTPDRPQPRLDRWYADGMGIVVGGVRDTTEGTQYNCLAHNTLRGAAGASLLNAELLVKEGWV